MQKLHFACKQNPDYYPFSGESYLYNSADYIALKTPRFGTPLTFYALRRAKAVARMHFFLQRDSYSEAEALSLPESPFGSLEFGMVTEEELGDFVHYVTDHLREEGIGRVTVKDCITAYRLQAQISVTHVLQEAGFRPAESLPNHHIRVDTDDILNKMSSSKRRRIQLCKEAGISAQKCQSESFTDIYDFIARCYASKGRKLSLNGEQLQEQFHQYPQYWHMFAARYGSEMVAACIAVQVHPHILYTFYYAASSDYDFYSPTTLLLQAVYHDCRENNIAILDLGTSNAASVAHFKKHMGGQHSFKHTYQLKLR